MRAHVAFACALLVACTGSGVTDVTASRRPDAGTRVQWSFDRDSSGAAPNGATVFGGIWLVRPEADAPSTPNALCQTGAAEFPAIVLSTESPRDVAVTAKVIPIGGREDQAAGVIFRVRDHGNYYIARANALEGNVTLFRYVDGRRTQLAEGKVSVRSGVWQELRAEAVGTQLRAFFDGRLVAEARDDTFSIGGVGLWTKADSVTCFDDVVSTSLGTP
jgi:hypothetical protein